MKSFFSSLMLLTGVIFLIYIVLTLDFNIKSVYFIIPLFICSVCYSVIHIQDIIKNKKMSVSEIKSGFTAFLAVIFSVIYIILIIFHIKW